MNNCKVSDKKCAPWYDNISDTLRAAKMSRRKAERRWRSSGLTVDKDIYDSSKKAVTTIIHNAKCAYYGVKIAESSNTKQLFRITDKLMARHSLTLMPTKYLNELPELFSNFFCNKVQQLEIISINFCRRLTRIHYMPLTNNSLVVHLIVLLQSQKIHYDSRGFQISPLKVLLAHFPRCHML